MRHGAGDAGRGLIRIGLGAGRYGGVTVPALPVRFVAGSSGGFADVPVGRRIAGVAGPGAGPETVSGFAGGVSVRYRAERRLLLGFLLVEAGHGATGGALAGGVPGYRRLRSPASSLHDRGHLDTLRPGEVLRHPDPASVA